LVILLAYCSGQVSFTPFDAKWVPMSAKFAVVGCYPKGTGCIQVHELDGSTLKKVADKELNDGVKCCTFGASSYEKRHLATGDYAGHLSVWDLDRLDTPVFQVKGHSSIINAIDGIGGLNVGSGAPEIVTGSRDGCVKVWDVRQKEPVVSGAKDQRMAAGIYSHKTNRVVVEMTFDSFPSLLRCFFLPQSSLEPAFGQTPRDCWSVCFGNSYNDQERCVVAGYDNGDIKLLDLRQNKLVWETNVQNGVVGLQFDRKDIQMNKLVVTSLESKFRVYDMRTLHAADNSYAYATVEAHKSTVWLARHLPQNRDLWMTTGGNGSLNLYKYDYPAQRSVVDAESGAARGVIGQVTLLNSRKFSDQPVVSLDWHTDKAGLFVCTALDQTVKVGITTKLQSL
jgi:WD40 repeat protein